MPQPELLKQKKIIIKNQQPYNKTETKEKQE